MDPYLEARWSDVHAKLIAFIGEALQGTLPGGLRARSEERVLLEEGDEDRLRGYRGDIVVSEGARRESQRAAQAGVAVAVPEPIYIDRFVGPVVDRWVQIIDSTSGNRVITAIEVLSPWNKTPGRLNVDYRKKLADFARGQVNIVEIDLLRSSREHLDLPTADIPPGGQADYCVCVHRAWKTPAWVVYPIPLREPIRPIHIPLREKDADVVLELQPLIDRVYVAGGHDDIDYSRRPRPELSYEDQVWANQLILNARPG
jgi:hypothetical protein